LHLSAQSTYSTPICLKRQVKPKNSNHGIPFLSFHSQYNTTFSRIRFIHHSLQSPRNANHHYRIKMHHSPPATARSISTSQLASQPAPSTDRCGFASMTGSFPCTQERGRAMTEKGTGNIGFKTQACAVPVRVLELRREGKQMQQHIVPRTNDSSKKMAIHNILNPTSSKDTSRTAASATTSITATERNSRPPKVRKDNNGAPTKLVPQITKSAFDNITPRNSAWDSKTPATCCKCTEGRKRGVWQPRWPGDTWA